MNDYSKHARIRKEIKMSYIYSTVLYRTVDITECKVKF